MSEQLAFHQVLGKRGAVEADKGGGLACAIVVQGARYQFLTRSTFSADQYGGAAVCYGADHIKDLLHIVRFANHTAKAVLVLQLRAQTPVFALGILKFECAFDD